MTLIPYKLLNDASLMVLIVLLTFSVCGWFHQKLAGF